MPHINLLYPFVPAGEVEKAMPLPVEACALVTPFAVTLASFHSFRHPSGTATLWLAPEPG
jgi:2'-5' RNA ligase superfamily